MKDKCKKCNSSNTRKDYTKIDMFVSYYGLICEDCGYVEHCRELR